jgi:hypothetical protein
MATPLALLGRYLALRQRPGCVPASAGRRFHVS